MGTGLLTNAQTPDDFSIVPANHNVPNAWPGEDFRQRLNRRIGNADDSATRTRIRRTEDIVTARQKGRWLAQAMGYSGSRITLVTTAISELARNILLYARSGELLISPVNDDGLQAIEITAFDEGPGIENLPSVLAGGVSTSGGLGLGLIGLQRAMDAFEIKSRPGEGTLVVVRIFAE